MTEQEISIQAMDGRTIQTRKGEDGFRLGNSIWAGIHGADKNVIDAIGVQVLDPGNGTAKSLIRRRSVDPEEEGTVGGGVGKDGPGVDARATVLGGGADHEIWNAVAVEIADIG